MPVDDFESCPEFAGVLSGDGLSAGPPGPVSVPPPLLDRAVRDRERDRGEARHAADDILGLALLRSARLVLIEAEEVRYPPVAGEAAEASAGRELLKTARKIFRDLGELR